MDVEQVHDTAGSRPSGGIHFPLQEVDGVKAINDGTLPIC